MHAAGCICKHGSLTALNALRCVVCAVCVHRMHSLRASIVRVRAFRSVCRFHGFQQCACSVPVRTCCAMPCLPQLIAHFFADRCTHSRLTDSAARSCKAEGGSRVACCRCALRVVGSTSRGLCLHRTLHGARLHGCRAQSRHVGRHCCAFHRRSAVATVQRIFVGNRASATHIRRCGPMWKPTGRPPLPRCCCGSDDRLPSQAKQNSTPPEATLRPPARGGGFHSEVSRRDREAVGGPDRVLECDHPSAHAADPQRFWRRRGWV